MARAGLFIRAEVRMKHPHFCCMSKQLQGSEITLQTQPGISCSCTGGDRAGSQQLPAQSAQSHRNSTPRMLLTSWGRAQEIHIPSPAAPWPFVHLLWTEGLPALPQARRLQGWGLTQLLPAPAQLQAHPLLNSHHENPSSHPPRRLLCPGVAEMKQNQSLALPRALPARPANISRDLWEKRDPHGNSHSSCCLISLKPYLLRAGAGAGAIFLSTE